MPLKSSSAYPGQGRRVLLQACPSTPLPKEKWTNRFSPRERWGDGYGRVLTINNPISTDKLRSSIVQKDCLSISSAYAVGAAPVTLRRGYLSTQRDKINSTHPDHSRFRKVPGLRQKRNAAASREWKDFHCPTVVTGLT
jgi:hypothetical protein